MYHKKAIIIAALLGFLLASAVHGAVPAWDKTFGGVNNESAASVQQTSDGGYIIAGTTFTYGAGGSDAWLLKIDANGSRLWDRTFGGINNESAASVQQTSDGGYIIAGTTFTYGEGGSDAWIIKTDSGGKRLWDKTFGGINNESAASVQQTSDGGYIIAGTTFTYGAGESDAWLIKTDANGNRLWDKTFGGIENEWAASVQQTSDGGYIIAGTTFSYGAGGSDAWLIKTDANGSRLWDKTFGGTGNESAASIQKTSDDGYIIAGTTFTYGAGGSDAWLLKTDANGSRLWDKTFGGVNNEWASSIQQTSDDGYIISGTTFSYGAGGSDAWLIKTDANGSRLWDKTFGGVNNESAASVQQTSDGGYIISGTTFSYGAGGSDAWLLYVLNDESTIATSLLLEVPKSARGFKIIMSVIGLLAAVYIAKKYRK
ncbi:hypothetical protein ANME2D_02818 [Candidatus Methanoperedens nitroreducens]|uniref:PGF-CTERM archaeal protein-sorting signal domain-containing protein n=1 Tax=Candidatus Methanoperedens nitratireducens TaxID=1392998 RepID=A0A062V2D4_9EURY|nr:PGF-CTERM sorting domain-containing protein [Candidatus Methanoperedens nitroreducens]KCZ70793.1 hypothetical protein ANME2D_02818 [Candidatus Methanoperedens nitroreducens]MDJ1420647.1 PGF-CTERM sorting domain-containing protein [Candidatus Methanoperedens sp.]